MCLPFFVLSPDLFFLTCVSFLGVVVVVVVEMWTEQKQIKIKEHSQQNKDERSLKSAQTKKEEKKTVKYI